MSHARAITSLNSSRALICDASSRIALRKGATSYRTLIRYFDGTCLPTDQSLSYMSLRVEGMAELTYLRRMLEAKSMNGHRDESSDVVGSDERASVRAMNPVRSSERPGKHTCMEGGFNAVRQPERKFAA
jgi:hypothetical protein